jgi:PPOX class probable F420-dependent enzyme
MLAAMTICTLAELPAWAAALLDEARVAHLGFLDDLDRPRVQPITFAVAGAMVWSAVDAKPKRVSPQQLARVRFLGRNPHAALTVDHYDDDWTRLAWVQVLGAVQIVDAADAPEAMSALAARYAAYRDSPPEGPLLALHPERCLCWRAVGAS